MKKSDILNCDHGDTMVFGVLLSVAIVVVLASIVIIFSLGFMNQYTGSKGGHATTVTMTRESPDTIVITNLGGYDHSKLEEGTAAFQVFIDGTQQTVITLTDITGSSQKFNAVVSPGQKSHVVVTAHFKDGIIEVVNDAYI